MSIFLIFIKLNFIKLKYKIYNKIYQNTNNLLIFVSKTIILEFFKISSGLMLFKAKLKLFL